MTGFRKGLQARGRIYAQVLGSASRRLLPQGVVAILYGGRCKRLAEFIEAGSSKGLGKTVARSSRPADMTWGWLCSMRRRRQPPPCLDREVSNDLLGHRQRHFTARPHHDLVRATSRLPDRNRGFDWAGRAAPRRGWELVRAQAHSLTPLGRLLVRNNGSAGGERQGRRHVGRGTMVTGRGRVSSI